MSCWETLNIKQTDQLGSIRKAYAQQLKINHPEEDPIGYQKLREAYNQAVAFSKMYLVENDNCYDMEIAQDGLNRENRFWSGQGKNYSDDYWEPSENTSDQETHVFSEEFLHEDVDAFITEAETLYSDFDKRIRKENWDELFRAEVFWNLEKQETLRWRIMMFIHKRHYFPKTVWKVFGERLNWKSHQDSLYEWYSEEFAEYIMEQIDPGMPFQYQGLEISREVDVDVYLDIREKILLALHRYDFIEAEELIETAYKMAPDDPDILLLRGEYELRNWRNSSGLKNFEEYYKRCQSNIEGKIYIALLLIATKNYENALKLCDDILAVEPENSEVWALKGCSYARLGKSKESLNAYLEGFKRDHSSEEARFYIRKRWNKSQENLLKFPYNPFAWSDLRTIQSEMEGVTDFETSFIKPDVRHWVGSLVLLGLGGLITIILINLSISAPFIGIILLIRIGYTIAKRLNSKKDADTV